ncbi:MAG: SpoIIE family protein phosphatase [Deltaproteobacteria bacterium]|nr:SpoIIE family protein phosphatase [Deltaproteobacteria bacterium]
MTKEPLEIIHRLSQAISKAPKLEEIYTIILEEIAEAMGVERASIMRFDTRVHILRVVAARGIEPEIWKRLEIHVGEGVSGRVWQEGKPLLIRGMKGSDRYKTHSFMVAPVTCFPMKVGETPIGIINLTDKISGEPFTESDLKLLTTLSDQVAAYLHLCDLLDQLKIAQQAKMQLEVAREIQQRLLPRVPPKIKGVDLAGCLIPAERVGADYYDFLLHGKNDLSLCIADVSGHSVGGALLASAFRSCLRAEVQTVRKPSSIVAALNKMIFPDLLQSEQFISVFYAQYQPKTKTLFFTNAGHNPGLLWQAKKKNPEWLFTQDSLLGIEPDAPYHQKKCKLASGDKVVLYTDGLTEAQNAKNERYGSRRLLNALEKDGTVTAQETLNALLKDFEKFMGGKPAQDDVSLVVMKVE